MSGVLRRRAVSLSLLAGAFLAMALVNGLDTWMVLPWVARRTITYFQALWPELMRAALFLVATPFALAFYRRHPLVREHGPKALLRYAAVFAAAPFVILPVDYAFFNLGLGTLPLPWDVVRREIVQSFVIMTPYYLLTLGGIFGVIATADLFRQLHERALAEARLRSELANARLAALRSQLEPHFLCNTLNGILPLLSHDTAAATRALLELKELFRLSLEDGGTHATLGRELEFLRRYLAIYERRFGARLSTRMTCEPGLEDARVPQLLLQPLVENAVRHGVSARSGAGHVDVRAARRGDRLVLVVADDGPGLARTGGTRAGGVGLSNTRARLASEFGDAARLELVSPPAGGLVATVEIPLVLAEAELRKAS